MHALELAVAMEAVRRACDLCRRVRTALVTEETRVKKDRSPVTIADLGAQAVISHLLHARFPQDPLMAEEDADLLREPSGEDLKNKVLEHVGLILPELGEAQVLDAIDRGRHPGGAAGRFWTMDPIDGTKGFIRNDQYAVALALVENGEIMLGVLGCPNLPGPAMAHTADRGVLFAARLGAGATAGGLADSPPRPMAVALAGRIADGVICQSVETGHTSHGRAARIAARIGITAPSIHIDSQCKYGIVARGEATIYMRLPSRTAAYEEKIWDHAAGCILVTESGGRVTDAAGNRLDFSQGRTLRNNAGVIATNGHGHDDVIAAVQAVLAEG